MISCQCSMAAVQIAMLRAQAEYASVVMLTDALLMAVARLHRVLFSTSELKMVQHLHFKTD